MSWDTEIDELKRRIELAHHMGGPEKIKRQHDAGRLTVRERIDAILDSGSFHEIGAIIANCNLIITSDTCIVHLAGGMGKKTWLLLKRIPEWRWGMEKEKTCWYPSVRLFRQKEIGDWEEVMERVNLELRELTNGNQLN